MNTLKQIAYKEIPRLSYKKIDLLINEAINGRPEREYKHPDNKKNDFNKWKMPKEPIGFIRYKKNDPL